MRFTVHPEVYYLLLMNHFGSHEPDQNDSAILLDCWIFSYIEDRWNPGYVQKKIKTKEKKLVNEKSKKAIFIRKLKVNQSSLRFYLSSLLPSARLCDNGRNLKKQVIYVQTRFGREAMNYNQIKLIPN